jgi:putative colanic acid biosynthesis UDP-glucose lipid carrier transferase
MMAERVRHDIWYLEHWSLGLDFLILGKTILQILKGDEQAY